MKRGVVLPPDPASAGAARRFVRRTLEEWGLDHLEETCTLLVSELVTNVILHARTRCEVHLEREGEGVRVGVRDDSPMLPEEKRYAADAATGRGLRLVEQLATRWGTATDPADGKVVWFAVHA